MKILILFGSSRGRTKKISSLIREELEHKLIFSHIDLIDIKEGIPSLESYDVILLGSSTWDRGDLQRDFYKREKELFSLDLKGKRGACFGSASILYPYYGEAVEILENAAKKAGIKILEKSLIIDDLEKNPDFLIKEWCSSLLTSIRKDN